MGDLLNTDQIKSLIRWVMSTVGTYLVAHNIVASADWASLTSDALTIIGAALPAISLIWSMVHHADQNKK